jgi:hypothetical protein
MRMNCDRPLTFAGRGSNIRFVRTSLIPQWEMPGRAPKPWKTEGKRVFDTCFSEGGATASGPDKLLKAQETLTNQAPALVRSCHGGLSRFVDGEHYFDNERALLAGRRTEPRRRTVECGLGPCRVDLNFQTEIAKFLRRCCTVTRRPLMIADTTSVLPRLQAFGGRPYRGPACPE